MSTGLHISSSCQHVPSHLCMIHCNFMIWLGVCWEVDCAGCAHACFNSNSHGLLITFINMLSSNITTHIMHHGFCCTHVVWSFPYTCASTSCIQHDITKAYPNHSWISSLFLLTSTFMRKIMQKHHFIGFCSEGTTFKNPSCKIPTRITTIKTKTLEKRP